jgi:protease I
MSRDLDGKHVAILVANGFEQVELTEPKRALEEAGAKTAIVSPEQGKVKAWNHTDWGDQFNVDVPLSDAKADEFDALVLPGGVMNPDKLRRNEWALQLVRAFFESGKPIAAICHGPWTLIDADIVSGKRMTSYPSIQTDLKNAGVNWVDEEVVVDNGFITSRSPNDLPAFNKKMIEEIAQAAHMHAAG